MGSHFKISLVTIAITILLVSFTLEAHQNGVQDVGSILKSQRVGQRYSIPQEVSTHLKNSRSRWGEMRDVPSGPNPLHNDKNVPIDPPAWGRKDFVPSGLNPKHNRENPPENLPKETIPFRPNLNHNGKNLLDYPLRWDLKQTVPTGPNPLHNGETPPNSPP